jgi:hypothetical protein
MRTSRLLALSLGMALVLAGCGKNGAGRDLNTGVNFATRSASGSAVSVSSSSSVATMSGSAPYFSLGSSSSSVPPFAMGASSSASALLLGTGAALPGMNAVAPGQYVKVHVDADKGNVAASDTVYYTVTVKNQSPIRMGAFQAILSFSPAQLSIIESDGQNQLDSVQWTIDGLDPGMKRALRVRAQVVSNVQNGDSIQVHAIATVNNFVQESTGMAQVTVGGAVTAATPGNEVTMPVETQPQTSLPHTGPGDYSGPLENTRRFLLPLGSAQGAGAVPAAFWFSVALLGIAGGMQLGKKML